jgi:glucose/mannose-6-phosphate isomerase
MNMKKFQDQLSFTPQLEGRLSISEIPQFDNVIIGGMGGSGLVARILFFLDPAFPAWLHDDYGLPEKGDGQVLYVAVSYSGQTAETLSFARNVLAKQSSLVIITSGGALLEMALQYQIPHILIPTGFEPRNAVVMMLRALLYVIHREELFSESQSRSFDIEKVLAHGQEIGEQLEKKIPLIYASRSNQVLAYICKIMLNESGKIPAFANYFPELAHNEIQGIIPETAGPMAEHLKVLLLMDEEDNHEIKHEMTLFKDLASAQGVSVVAVNLPSGKLNKLLFILIMASVATQTIADLHGVDVEGVPFIARLKKSL